MEARMTANAAFLEGEFQPVPARGITVETCRKMGYKIGVDKAGNTVQIADYRDKTGAIVGQKLRGRDKKFSAIGMSSAPLFGQHAWPSKGRRVIVTEGEIDALSVAQVFNLSWPVVSLPNGAQAARKAISGQIEWLEGYDEVVLMFDMDEPGRQAAAECAQLFTPGRCKIAELPRKDPNEMLLAGETQQLCSAVFGARTYRPDGIVALSDIRASVMADRAMGLDWFDPRITDLTFGRRHGEIYMLGAGTGCGKSTFLIQQVGHDLDKGRKVGCLFLEQTVAETGRRVAGVMVGKSFHVPDGSWSRAELEQAWDDLERRGNLHLYDSFGSMNWDDIKGKIRFMAQSLGCEIIYLDHLTALAAAEDDERKALERIMAEASGLANELQIVFHIVSHLSTPESGSHEEGARVAIRHFKGSRAIGFWSHSMMALERRQQADDKDEQGIATLRFLKDRYTGRSTGATLKYTFDHAKGCLNPYHEMAEAFAEDDDCPF